MSPLRAEVLTLFPRMLTGYLGESILQTPTLDSASIGLRRDFGARVEAYLDVYGDRNAGRSAQGVAFQGALFADDPNNPFEQDILFTAPFANLRQPVLFEQAVRWSYQRGYPTFVECSPHPVLTAGIQQSLDDSVKV